jgi:L-fuconolactonase
MPDFPIIDTHLHVWDPTRVSYPWLRGRSALDRRYVIEDYLRDTQDTAIEALVFLECEADPAQSADEIAFVEEQAQREPRIQAYVPRAPLERGAAVEPLIEALLTRFPRIKGIRRIMQGEPSALFLSESFIEGVRLLAKFGLHFEITVSYTQMDAALQFAERIENVQMMLDHCGKPGIRGGYIDVFHGHMAALARHPNVMCKLSGLATEADPAHLSGATLRRFIDVTLDTFGVDRVVYGGDWPVCLQAMSLTNWLREVDDSLVRFSEADRRKIYRDNANRFYRLGLRPYI